MRRIKLIPVSAAVCRTPTMIKLKSKQPKPVEAPVAEPSLVDRVNDAIAAAEAYIDAEVAKLRNGPDGHLVPAPVYRQLLTKGSGCACKAALRLMEEKR